jgi:hypothetical protein
MPGTPPTPTEAPTTYHRDTWLTSWAFSSDGDPGRGHPLFGTYSGDISPSISLSHSLMLSLALPPCLPFLHLRWSKPLQLTLTKQQPDNSALLAWVT